MKLYELFKAHHFIVPNLSKGDTHAMEHAERFDITNVADYYWTGTEQETWDIRTDFPNTAPPFPLMWMEFKTSPITNSNGQLKPMPLLPPRAAVLLKSAEADEYKLPEAKWVTEIITFIESEKQIGGVASIMVKAVLTTDKDGKPVIASWPFPERSPLHYFAMSDEVGKTLIDQQLRDDVCHSFWAITAPALLAVCFMHCKNVELVARDPHAEHKGKRNRHGYHVTYKELEITPMKKILRTQGRSESTGIQRALHICRGHFKDFSKGGGLFGKLHGTYWWGDMLRGHPEMGVVEKTYTINKPEEE